MISISDKHPDLEEVIKLKSDLNKVTKANISIQVSSEFFKAVKNNEDWEMSFHVPSTGEKIIRKKKARKLLELIAEMNWDYGDPGFLYWDKIKEWHMLQYHPEFEYVGTNPCGEQPLVAYGSCNLSSTNLSEFVENPFTKEAYIKEEDLANVTRQAVIFMEELLDEAIENKLFPLPQQLEVVQKWRAIGVGVMGFADMLLKLKVRYGSEESLKIIDRIGRIILENALIQSNLIAKEKGAYPAWDYESVSKSSFYKKHIEKGSDLDKSIKKYGLRHSHLLSIAPTGSISNLLGVSGGIEPFFKFSYIRKTESLGEEEMYYEVDTPLVREYKEVNNLKDDEKLPEFFIQSEKIPYKERIKVQAQWQKYVDTGISSTINLPKSATKEDVYNIYIEGYENGLKGLTVFRDGCAKLGILTSKKTDDINLEDSIACDT